MEIKEFVKSTLIQILEGVNDAQTQIGQKNNGHGSINPVNLPRVKSTPDGGALIPDGVPGSVTSFVNFDLAVIVQQEDKNDVNIEGKAAAKLLVANAGGAFSGRYETSESTNSTHRVKFLIPVNFS